MTPALADRPDRAPSRRPADDVVFLGVLARFALSGFAALLYETAWVRQFAVVFGTSDLAVATVLASYMAGLALGSALAARWIKHVRRPVLVYGLLEMGIAVSALLVPVAIQAARSLHARLLGGQPDLPDAGALTHSIFYMVLAFLILSVPTAFMGATLPLLTRHAVRRADQIGGRVGLLYAVNTGGAVAGTLVAAFVLLPRLGLHSTVLVGVGVNVLVFVIAVAIARHRPPTTAASDAAADNGEAGTTTPAGHRAFWILPLILVSGMNSFVYEVLWTRLLGHVLGASIFAFATMLASFLLGITLGSAIASRVASTRERSVRGFAIAQVGAALLSIMIFQLIDGLPALGQALGIGESKSLLGNAAAAALVLLPAALCIGATFPFAVRILARDERDAGPASARVYAWNTVGAVLGAVGAGFLLLPMLGFEGAIRFAVMVNLILALVTGLLWAPKPVWLPATAGVLVLAVAVVFHPSRPEKILRSSPLDKPQLTGEIHYYGVGRSTTVIMVEENGQFFLRTNGLPEAWITAKGSLPILTEARWLSALPAIARPEARSMLIVGLGGGVVLEGIPPTIEAVDVIELEPKVVEANQAIAHLRSSDPLSDPRVRVTLNDARGALSVTDKRYDVIVSQPSHPWTAGASHLYTKEFITQVKEHLNKDGVFVQWIGTEFVDAALMKTLGATLLDVYPNVRMYRPLMNDLVFLASDSPLAPEHALARTGEPLASGSQHYGSLGIHDLNDVALTLALEHDDLVEVCRRAPVNTDDRNLLAMRGLPSHRDSTRAPGADLNEMLFAFDPLLRPDSLLNGDAAVKLDVVYVARRLMAMGRSRRAAELAKQSGNPYEQLMIQGLLNRGRGDEPAAREAFEQALRLDPAAPAARFALVRPFIEDLGSGTATPEAEELAAGLTGVSAAVIEGWRHVYRSDWREVYRLDETLAGARPTDLWFAYASRLRAMWRTTVPSPEERRKHSIEALEIIDLSMMLESEPRDFLIRAEAANYADRPDVLLETARAVAAVLERSMSKSSPEANAGLRRMFGKFQGVLEALLVSEDDRVPRERVEQVMARLEPLLRGEAPGPGGRSR